MNIKRIIKNLKEQIKDKMSKINYLEAVIRKILTILWIWCFCPEILYIVAGIEERPNILGDPVDFLIYRAISVIITIQIINKWIVPKIIEKRIVSKIFSLLLRVIYILKKSIEHHKQILNFVVLVITVKFCSFNVISLSVVISNIPVINFMFNNLGLV